MRPAFIVKLSLVALALGMSAAYGQSAAKSDDFSNTLEGKVLIAVVSAVLSFVVGFILYYLRDRKEARARLSYNVEFKKGMLGIEDRLARDLNVAYKGKPAKNISYVRCDISNSGTTVVRKQRLRFELSKGAEILDWSIDPTPPKEVGFGLPSDANDGMNEKTFLLEYFPRGQQLALHFVVDGDPSPEIHLHSFNAEEDVLVVPGNIGRAMDDKRLVERFALIYLLTLFVPGVLRVVPGQIGSVAVGVFYFVVAIIIIPLLPGVARVIGALVSPATRRMPSISIGQVTGDTQINVSDERPTRYK